MTAARAFRTYSELWHGLHFLEFVRESLRFHQSRFCHDERSKKRDGQFHGHSGESSQPRRHQAGRRAGRQEQATPIQQEMPHPISVMPFNIGLTGEMGPPQLGLLQRPQQSLGLQQRLTLSRLRLDAARIPLSFPAGPVR